MWARAAARAGAAPVRPQPSSPSSPERRSRARCSAPRGPSLAWPSHADDAGRARRRPGSASPSCPPIRRACSSPWGSTAAAGWRRLLPALGCVARLAGRCSSWSSERCWNTRAWSPTRCSCVPGPWGCRSSSLLVMLRAGRPEARTPAPSAAGSQWSPLASAPPIGASGTRSGDVPRPRRRRLDRLLPGEREEAALRAPPRPGPVRDAQDRPVGRGQEHAHPAVGARAGGGRLRRRHLRADRPAGPGRLPGSSLRAAVADVRRLPFRDGSFDAVYSMGTIEHFRDPETALREMHRVLRPGGRAVVGVPNRWDPFLRPLLAAVLQALATLRLRLRAVLLAPGAPADAPDGRLRGRRRDRHPVRAGMAADGRPRPSQRTFRRSRA